MAPSKALLVVSLVFLSGAAGAPERSSPAPGASPKKEAGRPASAVVKRGRYLVEFGGCNDCHTPWKMNEDLKMPMMDMTRMLSGHPEGAPDPASTYAPPDMGIIGPTFTSFALPFGIVYSPNLTPDPTGLAAWSERMFVSAMRTGRHLGAPLGRPILPPMPWFDVAKLTDDDLKAIFAYLRSIPPIRNSVPAPKVPDEAIRQLTEAAEKMKAMQHARPGEPPPR